MQAPRHYNPAPFAPQIAAPGPIPVPCLPEPMNIVINEDLRAYIDPLTPEEFEALERSILTEGCRDALKIGRAHV